jgi:hypothetical protein
VFAGRTGLSQGLIDHDNQLCKVNFTSTRTLFAQSITQVTNVKGFASLRHQEEGNTILGSTCQLPLIIITHCLPKKPQILDWYYYVIYLGTFVLNFTIFAFEKIVL